MKITISLSVLIVFWISIVAQNAYIANRNSDNVSVINTITNTVITTINVGMRPQSAAVTPDGSKVYVSNYNSNTVSVINTTTNTVTTTITVGVQPFGITVAPDGAHVYVVIGSTGSVSIIDTSTETVTNTITVGSGPKGIAVTPDGANVYVANGGAGTVSVINTNTEMVTNTITLVNGLQGLAITPDGTKVYVTNESNDDVSVINTSTNMVTNTISVNSNPVGIAITPDGTQVYVTNRFADNVSVINVSTNMVTNTINVGCTPTGVAITLDGTKVYVANHDDNDVSVINVGSGMVTNTVNVGTSPYAFGDFIGSSLPPLPVELIRFNARQKGEDIHLSWETAVEIDNKEFQIEHNLDSKTWHVIGFIEGAGNSYKNLTYSFVHPNPKAGDNYYRLKQLDFSGVFEYSNIVSVNRDKAQTFRIYPNPAYSVVIFDLGNQFEEAEIIIYSSLGHIVRRINTDQNLIQVNMEDLELGVYWMNLQIDGKNYRGTFVKM